MDIATLMREVRRLEITARHAVTEVFAGEYSSAFKGRGIEFSEVREYEPGDDVRSIDWNVTARTGRPHIKRFIEERELTVMLAVDVSASESFTSADRSKRRIAAEVASLLAFAALRKNDRVGLLAFSDREELFVPPGKGPRHALRLVRDLLALEPAGRGTAFGPALDRLGHVLHRRSVVFVISDFLPPDGSLDEIGRALRLLRHGGRRHDVVAIDVSDPREHRLPRAGLVGIEDAETGTRQLLDTSSARVRRAFETAARQREKELSSLLGRLNIDRVSVRTDGEYVHELAAYFRRRERRR